MEEILLKLGIPTYMQAIETTLNGKDVVQLPKQLPNQIGWIYGISTYTGGVTPTNDTLITHDEADDLFLVLKAGSTDFIQPLRMSQLDYRTDYGNDLQYMPVNIPSKISLDQSYIMNPLGLTDNKVVMLNLFYIDQVAFRVLVDAGWMGANGRFQQLR